MNTKVIEQLASAVGVQVGELTSAIENKDKELNIDVAKAFTSEEWEAYTENISKEKDSEYNKGKEVGVRQTVRDAKDELGIEFEGKDFKTLIQKVQEKAIQDAGIDVDEKVKVVQKDLETLRNTYNQETEKYQNDIKSYENKYNTLLVDQEVGRYIPDKLQGVSKNDAMTIIKNEFSFERNEDGQMVVKKGGEILKDKVSKPVSVETAIKDSLLERKWLTNGDGRGETPRVKTTGFSKMSELNAYLDKNQINPLSKEAREMINKAASENEDFDFVN